MRVRSSGQEDPVKEGMASIPVFLTGESHGQRDLVGYSPQGHKELDMTEVTEHVHKLLHPHPLGALLMVKSLLNLPGPGAKL